MESVSVIVPAYKAAATIGRAIESVVGQSAPPAEIIVVDDGSPDDISGALKPFGSQVTLVRKANGGAASARNHGIECAKGDWIAFLDADDYWEPTKLERQLAVVAAHPEVGLIGSCKFEQVPQGERVLVPAENPSFLGRPLAVGGAEAFELAMSLSTSSLIVRRDVLADHRFDYSLATGEDRDMWVRLVCTSSVYLVPEPLATGVLEPGSLSRSDVDRDCADMLRVVHRNCKLLGRSGVRSQVATVYMRWAGNQLARRNPSGALKPAMARLRYQPFSASGWWVLAKAAVQTLRTRCGQLGSAAGTMPTAESGPMPDAGNSGHALKGQSK